MDPQLTFPDSEYHSKRYQIREEIFLGRMESQIPWNRLESVIELHDPKIGNGRRPYPLATMLRIHCMQQCHSKIDPAMVGILNEIAFMRFLQVCHWTLRFLIIQRFLNSSIYRSGTVRPDKSLKSSVNG